MRLTPCLSERGLVSHVGSVASIKAQVCQQTELVHFYSREQRVLGIVKLLKKVEFPEPRIEVVEASGAGIPSYSKRCLRYCPMV